MQIDIESDSQESDELEVLSLLVENYERSNFPIDPPSPLEALKFKMERLGLTEKDMTQYLGYRSRVSEVFSGKRKSSLKMIKKLHRQLGIPARSLLGD